MDEFHERGQPWHRDALGLGPFNDRADQKIHFRLSSVDGQVAPNTGARHRMLLPPAQMAGAALINDLLSNDGLISEIAGQFPLAEIAAAHEAVESGSVIGNIVVQIR